jgi:hypothetical protein
MNSGFPITFALALVVIHPHPQPIDHWNTPLTGSAGRSSSTGTRTSNSGDLTAPESVDQQQQQQQQQQQRQQQQQQQLGSNAAAAAAPLWPQDQVHTGQVSWMAVTVAASVAVLAIS